MRNAALFAAFLGLSPVLAMAEEPASIIPQAAPPVAAQPAAETPSKPSRVPTGVSEKSLDALSVDLVGISGGYGAELWKESKLSNLTSWTAMLRLDAPSPAMHALALNLYSAPSAPVDAAPAGEWLGQRLQMLLMLGEEKALKDISQMVPPSSDQRDFAERMLMEQEILQGNTTKACERVAANAANTAIYWARANLLCLASQKKDEELDLALKVLSEQGEQVAMEDALRKMAGESGVKLPTIKSLAVTPVDAATIVGAGMVLDNTIETASTPVTPVLARYFAEQSKWPLKSRTTLAERAFRAGALPVDMLMGFYKQFTFQQPQIDAFLKEKKLPENKIEAHALVLQQIDKETNIDTARDLIASAIPLFKKMNQQDLLYRAVAPKVKSFAMPAMLDGAWKEFAPQAVIILAAAGEDQAALGWWQALNVAPEKPESYEALRPLAGILFADAALSPAQMDTWLAKAPKPYAQTVLAAYTGLGIKVNPAAFATLDLKENTPYISFGMSQLMIDAAVAKRKGEVGLLGLIVFGEKGTNVSDMVLFKVLKEWQAAGLNKEAKLIAREALINRLP